MSNKIIKVVTGLFLGLLITMGVKTTVMAEVYYYVNSDGIFAIDKDTNVYAKMPAGSIIPEGATVYIEKSALTKLGLGAGYLDGSKYGWGYWYNPEFKAATNLKVGYDENGAVLKQTYNVFGTGEDIIGAQQAAWLGKTAFYMHEMYKYYPYAVPGQDWSDFSAWDSKDLENLWNYYNN